MWRSTGMLLLSFMALLALAAPSRAAFDMFLKIDGLPGASTDKGHKEWIDLQRFIQPIGQPMSPNALREGKANLPKPTGTAAAGSFTIAKAFDKSSPKLYECISNGTPLKEIVIELCRTDGDKQRFMEYKLTDVIISSYTIKRKAGAKSDVLPMEEISFNYKKIEWTYTRVEGTTDATTPAAAN